jgi:hypothetical protein
MAASATAPASAAARGANFSVRPANGAGSFVVADARPGQRFVRTLRVVNSGDGPGAVRLYAVDATTGATSGAVYRSEREARAGVGAWTALSRGRLRLAPGGSALVRVVVTVPRDVRPGQHLGAVVAENATLRRGRSVRRGKGSLRVDVRLLTIDAVQVNVPGRRFEHVSLTGARAGGSRGRQSVLLGIRNDGTELVKPHGSYVLEADSGRVLMRSRLRLDTIVPDTAIRYSVPVRTRALAAGSYRVRVELRYRGGAARRTMALTVSDQDVKQVFNARPDLAPPSAAGFGANGVLLGVGGLGGGLALAAGGARLRRRRVRN